MYVNTEMWIDGGMKVGYLFNFVFFLDPWFMRRFLWIQLCLCIFLLFFVSHFSLEIHALVFLDTVLEVKRS